MLNPSPISPKRSTAFSYAALFAVTIIWGWGFVFSQFALDAGHSPSAVMFGRFTLATLMMGLCYGKQIRANYKPGQWKGAALTGLFLFAGFYLQIIGLQHSTPANNAFVTSSYVVMVPLLWWVVNKKRPHVSIFVASGLCMAGLAILTITPSAGFATSLGDGLVLLSALFFSSQIVATGLYARSIHHSVLLFIQLLVSTILSAAAFLLTDRSFTGFTSLKGAGSILYLGILSTFVCYLLQTLAQKHVHAGRVALLLSCETVFGALFSVLVGIDRFSLRMLFGGALMFAAVLLPSLWRPKQAPDEKQPDNK